MNQAIMSLFLTLSLCLFPSVAKADSPSLPSLQDTMKQISALGDYPQGGRSHPKPEVRADEPVDQQTADAPLARSAHGENIDIERIKREMMGKWVSIAPEVRPSSSKNPDGSLKPFYLRRNFEYLPEDRFRLDVVNFADPFGEVPVARISIRGHMTWRGAHPVAPGAQKVDFVADEAYEVTPMVQGFADLLNKVSAQGYRTWEVNAAQSIFGKTFAPFGLVEGKNFLEFDLVYLRKDLLFWGARNIDGRGFDKEENRPTNLQIPMIRGG
jgi:hypothetical protein